jgi:hypothetical protein
MTRFEHFLRLCDLDGIVSAGTLARECGCSVHRAAEWLRIAALRDRIAKVAVGRYGRAPDGTPVKPPSDEQRAAQRRAQARIRERRKVAGVCHDCGGDSAGRWRCLGCRRVRAERWAAKRAEVAE